MVIYGILFMIIILSLTLYFIEWKYITNKCKLYKKLFLSLYFIEYCLVIIISYLITDTVTDFLKVAISFILINLMVSSIHRDWFKSKLYIRLTIVTVVPVVLLFIIAYISRFILTYNVFNIIMVVIIMSNTKSKTICKRHYIEFILFALSFISCFIIMKQGYTGEFHNKPQIYTINKMMDELEISYDDIVRVGKDGGLRGELIDISFCTTMNYYVVYYKDGRIIKYELYD